MGAENADKGKVLPLVRRNKAEDTSRVTPGNQARTYEFNPEEIDTKYRAFAHVVDTLIKQGPASYHPDNIGLRTASAHFEDLLGLIGQPESRTHSVRHALAGQLSDDPAPLNDALKPIPKNVLMVVNAYNRIFRPALPVLTPPARYNPILEKKQLKTIARARLILKKVREKQQLSAAELEPAYSLFEEETEESLARGIKDYNIETMENPPQAAAMAKLYLQTMRVPEEE